MRRGLGVSLAVGLVSCSSPVGRVGTETGSTTDEHTASATGMPTTETGTHTVETDADATDFVSDLDLPPEPVDCDPFVQDCDDGHKCVAYGTDSQGWIGYRCVPVLGDKGAGEPCTHHGREAATDDCDATTACFEGICTPLCSGTADDPACEPGLACLIASGVTQTVCVPVWCDPLDDECDGAGCYWVAGTFRCRSPLGDAAAGDVCNEPRECQAPSMCAIATAVPGCAGASCCTPLCELELGDAPCDAFLPGTSCVPFFEPEPAPEWFAHVGMCILP